MSDQKIWWITIAQEYLEAVHKLAISRAENTFQVRQSRPALTCLGFAYEALLKGACAQRGQEPKRSHDLKKLWENLGGAYVGRIAEWTKEYTESHQKKISEEWREAALTVDPLIGAPIGNFDANLEALTVATDRPDFPSRYPLEQPALMQGVDIGYLHAIGCFFVGYLKSTLREGAKT